MRHLEACPGISLFVSLHLRVFNALIMTVFTRVIGASTQEFRLNFGGFFIYFCSLWDLPNTSRFPEEPLFGSLATSWGFNYPILWTSFCLRSEEEMGGEGLQSDFSEIFLRLR